MEKLKIQPNGQWALEKWDKKQRASVSEWVDSGMKNHLDNVPPAKGDLRAEMISDMGERTQSRVNKDTGEKEHLMHRTVDHKDDMKYDNLSSWTTDKSFLHYWASLAHTDAKSNLHSAWVPEKHIHSFVPTVHSKYSEYDETDEGEVLVKPHDFNIHNTEQTTTINSREKMNAAQAAYNKSKGVK